MVEIVISVAAKISEYLVAPVRRPFIYLWNYKTNLENLKNEVKKLEAIRDSVESLIRVGEEPLRYVEIWQKSANQTIVEASKVVKDNPEQANIQCCKGFSCPNLMKRYQCSKNAAKKLKDVLKLEQEGAPFLTVVSSSTNSPDEPWLRSGDGYEAYESRRSVLKNIIDALLDPVINVVGIYGMGGIGKTTLAQKVAIHAKHDNLFHVIVFVEVSKTPDIKNIQQEIGGKLGLNFHDKTEGEQARALYDQLKKEVLFPNLNSLYVYGCDNLKELFSSSMVYSFVQLQYLEISMCSLLEEMVFMEELREEERKDTQFPFLKEMAIRNCPNFKGFIFNDKIGFPSLKAMEIDYCPKFKEFIFNDKVAIPNIEKLEISNMKNLGKIWHNQLVNDSFCKLKSLQVYECKKLLNVFPSNIYGRLLSLESLEVSNCDSLEEIMLSVANLQKLRVFGCRSLKNLFSASILAKEGVVMEEAPARFLFPKLTSLELDDLPQLRSFYPDRHKVEGPVLKKLELSGRHKVEGHDTGEIGFPSLKEMEIQSCPTFKEFIINDKVAVPNIEKLKISGMDNLEKIWYNQLVKDSFCKLKSLEVYHCKKLLNVFPSNIFGRLLCLESLEVRWCDSLEEIFDLRELSIDDSRIMLSFESLQRLEVSTCRSLKNLFSTSILAKEGVATEEAPARFLFPKLTSMVLYNLQELRSFYPGKHKVEEPVLKILQLIHCGIRDTDEKGQMQQPYFLSLVEQAFPCLEELKLDGEQVTMLCHGHFLESLFDRLKILQVNYDRSIFPFGIIQRCQNLEKLSLHESDYKEIFPHGEDQTRTKLKTLDLSYLKDLKYIWKQNSKLDLTIQNLEVLKVEGCDSLINLMPPPTSFQNPSTSFQNLTSLEVWDCDILINIGTSSVAKSLVQLTEMSISDCEKMTEVIGNDGDVIEDEIIFKKLKSLMLKDLPSLTSFYSWNFTLKFPSLETLTVQRCPNMKIFSQGDITTLKLERVTINQESIELHPDFNLNTAIQQSHEEAISAKDNGASSSRHLE